MNKPKKILYTGGGTGGPTIPLIAVYFELQKRHPGWQHFWLGTYSGPEKFIVKKQPIKFRSIIAAKLDRYLSFRLILLPAYLFLGMLQSALYLVLWRPDIILSVGGYISVPVIFIGWIFGIPSLIHQQDLKPGLANRLMSLFAKKITVSAPGLIEAFGEGTVVGNPFRESLLAFKNKNKPNLLFYNLGELKLNPDLPLVVVTGGGTGDAQINDLIMLALPELSKKFQIVHITGKNKGKQVRLTNPKKYQNYRRFEFLNDEYLALIAAADLVVSRAGMSALTELAILGKPSIIIPMPKSHQLKNADYFASKGAIVAKNYHYPVTDSDTNDFIDNVQQLLNDQKARDELSLKFSETLPSDASARLADDIESLV